MKTRPAFCLFLALAFFLLSEPSLATQNPQEEQPPLIKARSLYRSGRLDQAMSAYQEILASTPGSADAYVGLARAFLKKEKVAQAEEAAKKAIAADAKSDDAHVALGEVLFRKAFMNDAQLEFIEGLNFNPKNARALLGRARIFRAVSMYKHAHDFIVLAHQLDPADPEIKRFWLSTLSSAEEIAEMEKYLSGPHNDDPDERLNMETYLSLLKERRKEPDKRCKLVKKPEQATLRMERLMNGPNRYFAMGLKIEVNGQKNKLEVDTGASGILLSPKAAEKAGITSLARTQMGGIGDKGLVNSFVGLARSIVVGDLEFQNCLVEVSEKRVPIESDGLIGMDVFDKYLVTLDMPEGKIELQPLPKRPGAPASPAGAPEPDVLESDSITNDSGPQDSYVASSMERFDPIYRFGHMLLIPVSVGTSTPRLFLIDTGAFGNLISPEAAREVTKVSSDDRIIVKGVSGQVNKVFRADKAQLRFSHYLQDNQDIVAFDLSSVSKHTGTEVSGALGFTLLNKMRMTIDYRDGLVNFDYKGIVLHR